MSDAQCYAETIFEYSDPSLTAADYPFPPDGRVYFNILTSGGLFDDAAAGTVNAIFTAENVTPINNFLGTTPTLGFIDNIEKIYQAILAEITGGEPPKPSDDTWVTAYYGQWGGYDAKFAIPLDKIAAADIDKADTSAYYSNITHFSYGFGGFNPDGEIGTWDAWADLGNGAAPQFLLASGGATAYGGSYIDCLWGVQSPSTATAPVEGSGGGLTGASTDTATVYSDIKSLIDNDDGTHVYQSFRLAYIKKMHKLTTVLSMGGWQYNNANGTGTVNKNPTPDTSWSTNYNGYSPAQAFYTIAQDLTKLEKFTNTIANLVSNLQFRMVQDSTTKEVYPIVYTAPKKGDWGHKTTNSVDFSKNTTLSWWGDEFKLYDGIDIDWEYPSGCGYCAGCDSNSNCPEGWPKDNGELPADTVTKSYTAYANLLTQLKSKLGPSTPITTTVGGDPKTIKNMPTNVAAAFSAIDRVSIMTYDFMNGNSVITHNAPLKHTTISGPTEAGYRSLANNSDETRDWNSDAAVKNMKGLGVDAAKIQIGVPFYGRFQYVLASEVNSGNAITQSTLTEAFAESLFGGTTPGAYSPCTQSDTPFKCPWVTPSGGSDSVGQNSINYHMPASTSVKVCGTGDADSCDFTKIKGQFFEAKHEAAGVSYYISKKKVTMPTENAPKIADVDYGGKECYIVLSMPSTYSIDQKTDYIKTNGLGGVITWMLQEDLDGNLAKEVYTSLKSS